MKKTWLAKFSNEPSPVEGTKKTPNLQISYNTMRLFVSKFKCARKPNEKEVIEFIKQAVKRSDDDFSLLSTCLKDLNYTLTRYPTDATTLRALSKDGKRTLLIYGKMNKKFAVKGHVVNVPADRNTASLLKNGCLFLDPDVLRVKLYGPKHLKNIGEEESLYKKVKYVFTIELFH